MLEYFALGMLMLSLTAVFYIFVYIHDMPYAIAKKRNHPQQEAIHYACWLSLFTLHAIWPLVFMWAVSNRGQVHDGTLHVAIDGASKGGNADESADLRRTVAELSTRLAALEQAAKNKGAQA